MNRVWMVCACALVIVGCAGGHQHRHADRSPEEWARILENPKRDEWQRPQAVVETMRIAPTETIADIGAGTGYFTRRFAAVAKTVYAVEVDTRLVDRLAATAPANVRAVLGARDDPRLPRAEIDTVFVCNVLHHIDNRPAYYRNLRQAMRRGARLVIVDFHKREAPLGPPLAMRLAEDEVARELTAAGFVLAAKRDFLPHQYYLEFR